MIQYILTIWLFLSFSLNETLLHEVTYTDFADFVDQTGYVTDAEVYGWSFCQETVIDDPYKIICEGKNWKNEKFFEDNVVHVSYNDATQYCNWHCVRLPTLKEYWQLSKKQNRKDVWDWTQEGFIAGGSWLCEATTCAGYEPGNEKKDLSPDTSNRHIGFCVIK